MLSKPLTQMLARMESLHATATQFEAVQELRADLTDFATRQACLRCVHAGHVSAWESSSKDIKDHGWSLTMTHCNTYQSLPPNHIDEYGFLPAPLRGSVFHCTHESSQNPSDSGFDNHGGDGPAYDQGRAAAEAERVALSPQRHPGRGG